MTQRPERPPTLPPHPDFVDAYVPRNAVLGDFLLQILSPADVVEDFWAVIEAADLIRGVFEVDWPTGLTMERNLSDLERHLREFDQQRSFAWIIRDFKGLYLGCAYLYPDRDGRDAAVGYYWMADRPHREALLAKFGQVYEPWARSLCPQHYAVTFRCK